MSYVTEPHAIDDHNTQVFIGLKLQQLLASLTLVEESAIRQITPML